MSQIKRGLGVFIIFAMITFLNPGVFADEGTPSRRVTPPQSRVSSKPVSLPKSSSYTPSSKGAGWASGLTDALSDFQSRLPAIFHELSAEDIGVKPRLRPHFDFSNSFLSDANLGDKASDDTAWVARAAAGLTLEYPIGERLYTEADYTFGYTPIVGEKTRTNVFAHNADVLATYEIADGTSIGIRDDFQVSQVPGGGGQHFLLNVVDAGLSHEFGPKLSGSVNNRFQLYDDRDAGTPSQEFLDEGASANFTYEVTERIDLTSWGSWNFREFDKISTKDYWNVKAGGGVSYELGYGTTVNAHAGWNMRRFDKGPEKTDHSIIFGGGLTHNYAKRLTTNIGYSRAVQDTFDTGFIDRETAEAAVIDNLDANFRMITTDRVMASSTYHFNEQHSAGAFGDIIFYHGDREDNVILSPGGKSDEKALEVGASYTYRINRFISFILKYTFGKRWDAEDDSRRRADHIYHKATAGISLVV